MLQFGNILEDDLLFFSSVIYPFPIFIWTLLDFFLLIAVPVSEPQRLKGKNRDEILLDQQRDVDVVIVFWARSALPMRKLESQNWRSVHTVLTQKRRGGSYQTLGL